MRIAKSPGEVGCGASALGAEEVVEEGGAFRFEDAAADLRAVVEAAVADDVP
ncbi:hypothetical protein APR12_004963 [Nocardia amikacinitolerans]|nr:hypothetical protein [Nocardia amikacinitolerans]